MTAPHGRRFAVAALLVGVLAGCAHVVSAASATMTVSVTVARSCSVRTEARTESSSVVELQCASGATTGLRVDDSASLDTSNGSRTYEVQTTASNESLPVLTINF